VAESLQRQPWRLQWRAPLDGVRGGAILLVLAGHAHLPRTVGAGQTGVRLFFCLSGFLITALVVQELRDTGRLDFRDFYRRRALRLLPALVASTALVVLVGMVVGGWFAQWRDVLAVLLYVGNWRLVDDGLGGLAGTWSLSVEEQFYLLWPALLVLLARVSTRALCFVAVGGVAASLAVRLATWSDGDPAMLSYGTQMHVDALLGGGLLAVALVGRRTPAWSGWWAVPPALVLLVGGTAQGASFYLVTGAASLVGGLWMVAVGALARDGGPLSWSWVGWFGRRSYGIYLYHCPVVFYLDLQHPQLQWWWRLPIILAFGLGLAVISWRWVEQPFLRRKHRTERPVAAPAPLAQVDG